MPIHQHMDVHPHYEDHHELQENDTKHEIYETTILVLSTLTVVYIPVILMGNIMVIFATIRITKLHTPQNVILAIVSAVDLLFGTIIIPMDVISTFDPGIWHNYYLCWFRISSYRFILNTSLSFLMLLTIERFVAVNFVFHYHKITIRRVIAASLMFVILEIIKGPVMASWIINKDNRICNYASWSGVIQTVTIDRMMISFEVWIAMILSIQVAFVAWRKNKRMIAQTFILATLADRRKHREHQVQVKISICLLFAFVIIWLFTLGTKVLVSYSGSSKELFGVPKIRVIQVYSLFVKHLLCANAFLDPFIYAFVKPDYKTAYMFLIRNKPCNWNELQEIIRAHDRKRLKASVRPIGAHVKDDHPELSDDGNYSDQADCRATESSIERTWENYEIDKPSKNQELLHGNRQSVIDKHSKNSELFHVNAKNQLSAEEPSHRKSFKESRI